MPRDNSIRLFDLVLDSGCTISPFVWRIKYAIRHKGFDLDLVPNGFTGIRALTGGRSDRLPVIVDDGEWVIDSWKIADYLDARYPDRPMLYEGESQKILTRFVDRFLWRAAIGVWIRCYILDYHDLSMARDHAYVRESRERILGGRLEDMQAGREQRLPKVPPALEPLRSLLKETRWLGGERPNYADYCVLSQFLWCASVAKIPPLHDDDPLKEYIDRGFDLYGGLGRHKGLHNLFGLPKQAA